MSDYQRFDPPQYPAPPSPSYQGPPPGFYGPSPAKKRKGCLIPALIGGAVLAAMFMVVVVVAIAAGTSDDNGEGTPQQDVYAIGDTAHSGGYDVTVHQVVNPWQSSNQFENPQAGHHFVAVEASLTASNVDEELTTWSSLLGAELTDSAGRPWNVALAGSELPSLDGDVGAGQTRRGWVVFEVADDATGLQLRLKGNLSATGSLFDLDTTP